MGQILDSVMCVKEAEERFIVIYNKLIDNKEVDTFKAFTKANKKE